MYCYIKTAAWQVIHCMQQLLSDSAVIGWCGDLCLRIDNVRTLLQQYTKHLAHADMCPHLCASASVCSRIIPLYEVVFTSLFLLYVHDPVTTGYKSDDNWL